MSACTVHLVRHGEHLLPPGVLAGRSGVGLSAAGEQQAAVVARSLSQCGARAVLTSPVQRAQQTARPIGEALGLHPTVEPGIEEIDFGIWTGQPFEMLGGLSCWRAWNAARGLAHTPAGDSMLALQMRAVAALARACAEGGTIIAVSHADVIKAVLAYALGSSLDLVHRFDIALCSRSVIRWGDGWAVVDGINLPA